MVVRIFKPLPLQPHFLNSITASGAGSAGHKTGLRTPGPSASSRHTISQPRSMRHLLYLIEIRHRCADNAKLSRYTKEYEFLFYEYTFAMWTLQGRAELNIWLGHFATVVESATMLDQCCSCGWQSLIAKLLLFEELPAISSIYSMDEPLNGIKDLVWQILWRVVDRTRSRKGLKEFFISG